MSASAVHCTLGEDGVLLATMDLPGRPMNVVGEALMQGLAEALDRLADPACKGLLLTSAKADFCAGGDIDRMAQWSGPQAAAEVFAASMAMKAVLRRMETQGKPVAAVMAGHALGGGLEIALACHARWVLNDKSIKLGQPEVKIGLLPGGGGCVRLPRLVGIQAALEIMSQGEDIPLAKAQKLGLVTGTAATAAELLAQARAWVLAHPAGSVEARQPWDRSGFRFPGGDSRSPAVAQMLAVAPSVAAQKTFGNYPAVQHILSAVFEGGLLDFEAASEVEARYFAACATSAVAKNMINTLWFELNALKKGAARPAGVPKSSVKKLGVLGAGMMGAGIAHVAAKAGIEVVLLDTTLEAAERGKAHSKKLVDQAVQRGRLSAEAGAAQLARIAPATQHALLAGCELVIEAVFEDRSVKAEAGRAAEPHLASSTVWASNTSTLPITGLAAASARPQQFIGLHFFSPVEKMPLVEIIVGRETSDETLARGFDLVQQLGKTPIVVNDSRGFFTSRVFATYVLEGAVLLAEGVHPRHIEAAGLQAGMPMPPLALQDEVSLELAVRVAEQTRKDLAAAGQTFTEHPGMAVLRALCEQGRIGKKAGAGFYDWSAAGRRLWPGLATQWPVAATQPAQGELIDRLLFAQAVEAARCFEEGVLRSVAEGNVGSIFGWGFAPFHGGVLQFIRAMGSRRFCARAAELAQQHGPRFAPPPRLQALAASDGFYQASDSGALNR